jgi:formylglycine-generating enzyme required for sulfatase activity
MYFMGIQNELLIGLLFIIASLLTGYVLTESKVYHETDPVPFEEFSQSIEGTDKIIKMVPVPGGQFTMGSDKYGGKHEVVVDSFWISKYEITWDLYNQFAEASLEDLRRDLFKTFYGVDIDADAISSPTLTDEVLEVLREADIPADVISTPSPSWGDLTRGMGTDGYPAVNVTHYAAHMFTKWLTVKTGNFYRLPTEAEWELACRGGIEGEGYPEDIEQHAWHRENSGRSYHQPGSKEPNSLGIHDMLGNVAEWTFDQYYEDYFERLDGEPAVNPWFRPDELYPRAVRGGSWLDGADQASCFQRRGSNPNWKRDDPQLPKSLWWHTNAFNIGFRVVKPANQPETAEEMEEYWIEAIQDYN